jgi:TPP-dependent pyruvate/acetoin dehydrogenase alpha subunit
MGDEDFPYIYKKGPAFGMPGVRVDGMDVLKVRNEGQAAAAQYHIINRVPPVVPLSIIALYSEDSSERRLQYCHVCC